LNNFCITVNTKKFGFLTPDLTLDGFGFTFTGGSAFQIKNITSEKRKQLLTEMFAFDKENIGNEANTVSLSSGAVVTFVF
jgi:hypothetical protein